MGSPKHIRKVLVPFALLALPFVDAFGGYSSRRPISRRPAASARSMYPQTSGAYPGVTTRAAAGALSAWDAVGRLHRRRGAGALSMYPQSASAAYPGDTARGAGATMSGMCTFGGVTVASSTAQ